MRFRFENHELDGELRELTRDGVRIPMQPQVFDLLLFLVEQRDRLVSKDELIGKVWGDRAISDSALNSRINAARTAIGDDGKTQRSIRTIPRKGFRFVGDCVEVSPVTQAVPVKPDADTGSCRLRPPGDRRARLQQHERRSGPGLFLRRDQRRHPDRALQAALVSRHRPQLVLHLQGQERPHPADRRGARGSLCGRGQRAQGRRSRADHRAIERRHDRQPSLGGTLRPRPRRRLCRAGRDHQRDRGRHRAANPCGGKFSREDASRRPASMPGIS